MNIFYISVIQFLNKMRLAIICLAIFAISSRVEKSEAVGGIGGTMGYEMNPIKFVYLDFDKTIAVNDYSEKVRNRVCVQKYPACDDFDESDAMVSRVKLCGTSNLFLHLKKASTFRMC